MKVNRRRQLYWHGAAAIALSITIGISLLGHMIAKADTAIKNTPKTSGPYQAAFGS